MNIGTLGTSCVDLSKTTKLKNLKFRWKRPMVQWIILVLRTVESKSLEHITIYPVTGGMIKYADHQEWKDLDRLLV